MRLAYLLELVLAIGVGLGLARYRLNWPDLPESYPHLASIDQFEVGSDSFLAGVGLVGGLALGLRAALGRERRPWGPGRWVWFLIPTYLLLTLSDRVAGTVAARSIRSFSSDPLGAEVINGFWGDYGGFLLPADDLRFVWFLLAAGLTGLVARAPHDPAPDAREWAGRVVAVLIIVNGLGLRALLLFGIREQGMGGG
jgi:hypothetical protein